MGCPELSFWLPGAIVWAARSYPLSRLKDCPPHGGGEKHRLQRFYMVVGKPFCVQLMDCNENAVYCGRNGGRSGFLDEKTFLLACNI